MFRLDFSLEFQISPLMLADVAACKPCNCSISAVICKSGINIASLIDVINYKVLKYCVNEGPVNNAKV